MDEIQLRLQTRTTTSAFSAERTAVRDLVLFGAPERYVVDAPVEDAAVAELRVTLAAGSRLRLHSLVVRQAEGADLYRWAGAGELFRQSRSLRFGAAEGAVRIESLADDGGFNIGLDPAISGEALQLLLTLSADPLPAAGSAQRPDRIAAAVDHLVGRVQQIEAAVDAAAAEARRRHESTVAALEQQLQLAQRQMIVAEHQRDVAEDHRRTTEALRLEEAQRHEALMAALHHHLGGALEHERARSVRAEAQAAHLREVTLAQQEHLNAVLRSSSWRITGPIRWLMRLATGRRIVPMVLPQPPPAGPDPAPAPPQPAPPTRPAPARVAFPAPGAAAVLGELAAEPPKPLDLTVSVIIPTFNAGTEFYWLLRKLQAQQGLARVEIVVVDSGSSDGTDTLAEEFGATVVRIPNSEFSHSHARNLGADNAAGDLFVFTVQDAYPVGDWWLHSLALALTEPASEATRAAAVSCSEFPRRDSELLYNAAIDTHYRFLGCRDADRFGRMVTDDHMSLRSEGQLSDVACMIPAETFRKYRYEGRYAEDLMLGVRLLRDGLKTAMLSSVRVIHSHNRPAAYHLKRTFVDVVFLTEVFPDFATPAAESAAGVAAGASRLAPVAEAWRPTIGEDAAHELRAFTTQLRATPIDAVGEPVDFGFAPLRPWLEKAMRRRSGAWRAEAEQVRNMFADRLDHLGGFVERTYGEVDDHLAAELSAAVRKTLAATVGAQLAFLYLHVAKGGSKTAAAQVEELRTLMTAGI